MTVGHETRVARGLALRELAAGAEEVYVYFNNDASGLAVANATKLAELLGVPVGTATS